MKSNAAPTAGAAVTLAAVFALPLLASFGFAADAATEADALFATRVLPLLTEKCLPCHGKDPEKLKGDLDLRTREAMLHGGESAEDGERALVPGDSRASLIYTAVTWKDPDLEMPPKKADRLTEEQTWWIRDWIDAGAPWPDAGRIAHIVEEHAQGITVKTSGGLSDAWTKRRYDPAKLWAYQPLRKPEVPWRHIGDDRDANPIDAFLNRRIAELGLEPAPRADRRMLIRRASYGLIGLPPAPEDVRAFVDDPGADEVAFARVVERLLSSQHHGEHWGRHWLDVVRYADTAGFANDFERPNAWRYRDYVVRSFNEDKPWDRFVREQLAGDELDPGDPEMLIATGFLRMGPWEHTGMSVAKITRQQFLDDITDSVGQVFLSHPLQCCRCHDHKFDPIPTRDYYAIQAVFATTQFADREAPFLESENPTDPEGGRELLETQIRRYRSALADIRERNEAAERHWYSERGLDYAPRRELEKRGVPDERIAPRHIGLDTQDFGYERVARKNSTRHRWELDRYRPLALSVYSGKTPAMRAVSSRIEMPRNPEQAKGELEKTAILTGGDPFSPSEPVTPGGLSCVPEPHEIPESIEDRRRAFAEWVASPRNPLTARSIVNRVWQYHFGQGLARNPNNFGAMGKPPTHPELLDWLTANFVESGWSIKKLHRLIMSSDAYARSSRHPKMDELREKDVDGISHAVFSTRRLSAEELRDAMLRASGELQLTVGGVPIRPDMNLEAALQPRQIMGTYAPAYQPSPRPEQRNRRSIYAVKIRGQRDPFMEVFNQPSPDLSCERRETSTVTPQVFTLFNSAETLERAVAMAMRVTREVGDGDADRPRVIDRIFEIAYARPPGDDERAACLEHWDAMTERHGGIEISLKRPPTEIVRHAIEEMNGKPFTFLEKLDVYESYISDPQPGDVDPRTRGLAEVCLVILNSNEFAYVP